MANPKPMMTPPMPVSIHPSIHPRTILLGRGRRLGRLLLDRGGYGSGLGGRRLDGVDLGHIVLQEGEKVLGLNAGHLDVGGAEELGFYSHAILGQSIAGAIVKTDATYP